MIYFHSILIAAILCIQCNTSMLYITLSEVLMLQEIRDDQRLLSLGGNLRSLKLKNCKSLVKLFPPSLLQNLQVLTVENCDKLEQVFDLDDAHVGLLPKLAVLVLIDLPKLRHICNNGNTIFPKLIHISLKSLPNLSSFSSGYHSSLRLHHADLDTPFPVLFNETVSLSVIILFFF